MPPRKSAPGSRKGAGSNTASPAKSTRSTKSRGRDDDEESVASSFHEGNSRSRIGAMHLSNTSVNIANAFATAQASTSTSAYPSAPRLKPPATIKHAPHQPPSPADSNYRSPSPNLAALPHDGRSTQDRLRDAAKATSPVRYILQEAEEWDEGGSSSFAANTTNESAYNYSREESIVRARLANGVGSKPASHKSNGNVDLRRRQARGSGARDGDMPYRPAEEEDDSATSDSGGEGVVTSGALDGRAGTRGKRAARGEGYLGNGLGLTQRSRPRRSRGGDTYAEGDEEEEEEELEDGYRQHSSPEEDQGTPMANRSLAAEMSRHHSPFARGRSATPVLDILRAKQPTTARNIATNLVSLAALSLRWSYDFLYGLLDRLLLREAKFMWVSSKGAIRWMKQNCWKVLLALVALSLASRLRSSTWSASGQYTAPDLPPGSMDEIASRLGHLEKALSSLSSSSLILEQASEEAKRSDESISSQILEFTTMVRSDRTRVEAVREEGQASVRTLQNEVESLREEVGKLKSRVTANEKGIASAEASRQTLVSVQKDVQALNSRIGSVEKDLREALDDGRIKAALERILPREMPVRKTPQGTLSVDPLFWSEMKKVFMGKDDVALRRAMSGGGSAAKEMDESTMEAWGERFFSQKSRDGAVISRAQFVQMLDRELLSLRETIDELPKSSAVATGKSVTIKSSKGDDLTGLFNELIDAALLRYSKDTIAKPDYALFTAGARVVPSITSDTLVLSRPGTIWKWVLGKKDLEGRQPATALHPDTSVGSCWPFQGSQGQLGVLLNRRVKVSDITLEHAASDLALDISTAPKNVEVWGLVEGTANQEKVAAWLANMPEQSPSLDRILLANVTYDPSLSHHIQTFPVDAALRDLDVDVGIVVFKVESNWGGEFTCLYRVRVHGEAA